MLLETYYSGLFKNQKRPALLSRVFLFVPNNKKCAVFLVFYLCN